MTDSTGNTASTLERRAKEIPDTPAVIVPRRGTRISFLELHEESNRLASGFSRAGMAAGQRVLLMVPFGIDFIAVTFALFRLGAVPVLIDPGLGRENTLHGIEEAQVEGMVAVPRAHAASKLFSKPFAGVRVSVTVGRRWFWGGMTLNQIRRLGETGFDAVPAGPDTPAAILFTSGSTGPSKGVLYTHGMFLAQIQLMESIFQIRPGEVDLPTFPLFGLFSIALGMTCVIPEMDPTRPAQVNPENIIRVLADQGVTSSFGSPALWDTVSRYCLERNIRLPSLRRILMAGAPVPGGLLQRFDRILEKDGEIQTPYGATEALPVASITAKEVLADTWKQTEQGRGICVGQPVEGIEVKIIRITDDAIPDWNPALELPPGEIGEIVVRGPWVTRHYFNRQDATRLAKISDGDRFWHRMGDAGFLDERGRLWFCGRKNHRVTTRGGTLYTIPCEAIYNTHPDVKRSALVGIGSRGEQTPVIVIEPENSKHTRPGKDQERLIRELLDLGGKKEITREIRHILFHPDFPVDIRHNAKIFREKLALWARDKVKQG